MKGGTLKLNSKVVSEAGIGSASKLMMQGGKFVTVGKNEANVTYNFPIEVAEGTTSTVDFDLWNTNKCSVSGKGTLTWNVHYLREYIEGNWDNFTGQLIVNGTGDSGKSQFAIRNGAGIKNATITLKGTASINSGKSGVTLYLGGLSGDAGTVLAGFNVKAKGNGTWIVGGANTDETFRGVINNNDQAGTHPGTTTIEKEGSGDWRLTGNNVYSGTTTVSKGRLIINGTHSGTGAVSVKSGATLAGIGSLAAATTINSGAMLQVGDTLVNGRGLTFNSTLNLSGTATLNVLANSTKSNSITLKGSTTLGASSVLQINGGEQFEEAPEAGTEYQIFKLSGGKISGTFKEIQPAIPGEGLTWDTSELYSAGKLKVAGSTVGIQSATSTASPLRVEYYSLSGQRITAPEKGICIMRTIMQDGSIISQKVGF
jgi:autotransporter-associated beta strand protein